MSLFKKTRLDHSLPAQNQISVSAKEAETNYPRVIEDDKDSSIEDKPIAVPKPSVSRISSPKTINPYMQAQAKPAKNVVKLIPINKENESKTDILIIENPYTLLNRDNIDPDNPTISAKGHALIEINNNEVFLSNQTAANTTFIQVKEATQLQNGDVILLGDRLVRVEIENKSTNGLDD